jgi:hypothetical protein
MSACICEACKADRAEAKAARQKRKEVAAWHRRQLQAIEGRLKASADAEWVTGRGEHVRVQAMAGSHLFYAIAKGYRGEYPTQYARALVHLENEALRRLLAGVH